MVARLALAEKCSKICRQDSVGYIGLQVLTYLPALRLTRRATAFTQFFAEIFTYSISVRQLKLTVPVTLV